MQEHVSDDEITAAFEQVEPITITKAPKVNIVDEEVIEV